MVFQGDPQSFESATYLWAAEVVLRKHGRPLKAREIVSFGIEDGLFADRQISKTPQRSMQARLSIDILEKGAESKFLRTGRGSFFLRDISAGLNRSEAREYPPKLRDTGWAVYQLTD
jgi:HB1, ASXL, restriction endonuclease HTH domain